MFASSLPLLPPPATSFLPSLYDRPVSDTPTTVGAQNSLQAQQQQQQQQQQRRIRGHPHSTYPRSDLAILAHEERLITQRKIAIATYGYSWLKPAGCAKTMLGRREEEIEREEVERQLREAELQEHNAAEAEDAEREAQLGQQRVREVQGEDVGADGERDLDEDVPDMDEEDADNFDDEGSDENYEDGEDDLDNSIPEGDSAWRYDTTRDPDTESEEEAPQRPRLQQRQSQAQGPPRSIQNHAESPLHDDIVDSALYEDEMVEYGEEHDLDDDIPGDEGQFRDLDDDVPEAGSEDGEWEHTDTELEESEMDISIMPPGVTAHHHPILPQSSHARQVNQRNLHPATASQQSEIGTGLRRTSGNIPSSLPSTNPAANPQTGARGLARSQNQLLNFTPDQFGSDFSVSPLISTGHTNASPAMGQSSNSFSDTTGPRRNLFGTSRAVPSQNNDAGRSISGSQTSGLGNIPSFEAPQMMGGSFSTNITGQVSSGGLFTPSPQQQQQQNMQRTQRNADMTDTGARTTRSGRRLLDRVIPPRRPGAA